MKSGTYTLAAGITTGPSVASPSYTAPPTRVFGYGSIRGDITPNSANQSSRPVLQPGSAINAMFILPSGYVFANLAFSYGSNSYNYAVYCGVSTWMLNIKVSGFGQVGIYYSSSGLTQGCEVTGGSSGAVAAITSNSTGVICGNYVHDNACPGIVAGPSSWVDGNVVTNNAGATSDGIQLAGNSRASFNTVYGSGRHGINITASSLRDGSRPRGTSSTAAAATA